MSGCLRVGAVVGVALDLDAGAMRVAVADIPPPPQPEGGQAAEPPSAAAAPVAADWKVAFAGGVRPGEAVGSGLFPAVSGCEGVQIRYNLGDDLAARPLRLLPPSGDYTPVAAAGAGQVRAHSRRPAVFRSDSAARSRHTKGVYR
jgi:hypothetical protein